MRDSHNRCVVCGRPPTEESDDLVLHHGMTMHTFCAPSSWEKDRIAHVEFMERVYAWWEAPAAYKWKHGRT